MKIGFTGTQQGLTTQQKIMLKIVLSNLTSLSTLYWVTSEFHFGLCVGADDDAAEIASKLNLDLIAYPGVTREGKIWNRGEFSGDMMLLPEKFFLDRNRDIVDQTQHLVACPREFTEQLRSGTWSTVRYAKKSDHKTTIIYPDGTKETK